VTHSWEHEIGHLAGLRHQRYVPFWDYDGCCTANPGPYCKTCDYAYWSPDVRSLCAYVDLCPQVIDKKFFLCFGLIDFILIDFD
jgi:hypothetical protein